MMQGGNGPPTMPGEAEDSSAPPSDMENERPSVFLGRDVLGGKTFKEGDTITLTVRDVDPETGDVQADFIGGGETKNETGGYAEDFDNAMPEEGEMED